MIKTKKIIIIFHPMTSFIAKTFGVIAHQAETVVAVLGSSRTLMNSSIVPVVLSDDSLWRRLCTKSFSSPHFRPREGVEWEPSEKNTQWKLATIFLFFCDTTQFMERLTVLDEGRSDSVSLIFNYLSQRTRYFCRTLQHMDFLCPQSIADCSGKLGNLRSCHLRFVSEFAPQFSGDDLKMLCDPKKFPRLQRISWNWQVFRDLTDEDFQVLANAASLETLDLSGSNVASLGFLSGLKRLKELNLADCDHLSFQPFTDLENTAETTSRALLPSLESIILKDNGYAMTSSSPLQFLLDHAPVLQVLKCDAPRSFEGAEIISQMRFLRTLQLRHCDFLDEKCFKVLFSNLAHLEIVQLNEVELIDDACLLHLSRTRSPIRELVFVFWVNITDKGLGYLTSLKYLEVLNFRGDSQIDNNDLTGETGLNAFSQSMTKLSLTNCCYITDAGLASTLKFLSSLRELHLHQCAHESLKVTSEGLKVALEGSRCQNTLEVLNLDSPENIFDFRFVEGLKALKRFYFVGEFDSNVMRCDSDGKGFGALSSCRSLISLSLSVIGIEDNDIIRGFPPNLFGNLEEFNVWSRHLTDRALIDGISRMKNLRKLRVHNTNPYTIAGVLYAVQQLPHLHLLEVNHKMENDIRTDSGVVGKQLGPFFGKVYY